jgi:hypothetical protein
MNLPSQKYLTQRDRWPTKGRHILAHYNDESVVVYQAYRPSIGHFAANHGYFGGEFSLNRMSWIKPNFLWMMYRSGWGTKPGQQVVLAVRLRRAAFDEILSQAVHSSFMPEEYGSKEAWQKQVRSSEVRLQWDPDHSPSGAKQSRRAIQLGLRGSVLQRYAREWILDIQDVSGFVAEQRAKVQSLDDLLTPIERCYVPAPDICERLRLEREQAS